MDFMGTPPTRPNVEHAKNRIFNLINQCICEIEKTATTSGLTMRDVGVGVEKYMTIGDSYLIELKLRM